MSLLRRTFKAIVILLRVYSILFCILSLGYFFNNHVFKEEIPIAFTFDYFSHIFIEGALVVMFIATGCLCLMSTLKLATKKNEGTKQNRSNDRNTQK